MINLKTAHENWLAMVEGEDKTDDPAMSESWNNYVDALNRDGELCDLQAQYAPAWDSRMPKPDEWDDLAGDRALIVKSLGLERKATFIPWSQSRNRNEDQPSLNWLVTLLDTHTKQPIVTADYMQGSAFCPSSKAPVSAFYCAPYNRTASIRTECEQGITSISAGSWAPVTGGHKIPAPGVEEVLAALVHDTDALDDCEDFEDWALEVGYDPDSRKAEAIYRQCVDTNEKLVAYFGQDTLDQLKELYQDA